MREVKVIAYEAFDGEIFINKSQCELYESEMRLKMNKEEIKKEYDEIFEKVTRLCDVMSDLCTGDGICYCGNRDCPFHSEKKDCGCQLDFPEYK